MLGRKLVRTAFDTRIWAPNPRALVKAASNSTNTAEEQPTFAASLHLAASRHLQRTPIHCADTHALPHTPPACHREPPPTNCTAGPDAFLSCCAEQRPRLAEHERDTFYTTTGQLAPRAILRPAWTRSTRMWAASRRSTRRRSSKKVRRPGRRPAGRGGDMELTRRSASIQPEPRLAAEMQSGMLQ
jgi:hypothetical protein